MSARRLGIIMNGVTGRMGTNQHLVRSIVAIRKDGGVTLANGDRVMPDPILVGRNAGKIEQLARQHHVQRWTTDLGKALDSEDQVFFDAASTQLRPKLLKKAIAAGKPVVSTSIRDVVKPYGQRGLVRIADTVPDFVAACEAAMTEDAGVVVRQHHEYHRQREIGVVDAALLADERVLRIGLAPFAHRLHHAPLPGDDGVRDIRRHDRAEDRAVVDERAAAAEHLRQAPCGQHQEEEDRRA